MRRCRSRSTSFRSQTTSRRPPAWRTSSRVWRGVLTVRGTARVQHRRRRPGDLRGARRVAHPLGQGPERQHGRAVRAASVHGVLPGQGGPVRREAGRLPEQGSHLRGSPRTGRPRRRGHHPREAVHGRGAASGVGRPSRRVAAVPAAVDQRPWRERRPSHIPRSTLRFLPGRRRKAFQH
jgi:hypothetical protein